MRVFEKGGKKEKEEAAFQKVEKLNGNNHKKTGIVQN